MKSITSSFMLIVFLNTNAIFQAVAKEGLNLKLVNVVFRHGDRTPDLVELYPNDPNTRNNDFYPIGYGGLTNDGKFREYNLGRLIREMYDGFLGQVYLPESVFARSTDYSRTKMSLQLVLAGLYPPIAIQQWNNLLKWQPIPATYVTLDQDYLMASPECIEFLKPFQQIQKRPDVANRLKQFDELRANLTKWTGKKFKSTTDLYTLYHLLISETFMNLTLPKWTKDIFPHGQLHEGVKLEYELMGYTKQLRKLSGGKLLFTIIDEMKSVINGTKHKNHKINLYSGHEINVAAMLQVLGLFIPHVPAYSSAVILELYEIDSEYYVKVVYFRGIPAKFVVQPIPGCEVLCPFKTFVKLYKDVLPKREELKCEKH